MHDISKSSDTFFLGHPKGLVTLFLTEMWERMSFYGMRGLLVLFMTREVTEGGMNLNAPEAMAIYGIYGASVYFYVFLADGLQISFLGPREQFSTVQLL